MLIYKLKDFFHISIVSPFQFLPQLWKVTQPPIYYALTMFIDIYVFTAPSYVCIYLEKSFLKIYGTNCVFLHLEQIACSFIWHDRSIRRILARLLDNMPPSICKNTLFQKEIFWTSFCKRNVKELTLCKIK